MNAPFENFNKAQSAYDRELPKEDDKTDWPPFADIDVECFIDDVISSDSPADLLESWGVCSEDFLVQMIVEMCKNWRKNSLLVYSAAGVYFWRVMKQAALERYNFNE